jgi:nitrous oxide reductase accessory protein NosL
MTPKKIIITLFAGFIALSLAAAAEVKPIQHSKKDKCPVCGMFVYKYPDWVAEIAFKEGSIVFFDGAKDLFKFYQNLKKYKPEKTTKDIAAILVTEYYDMELIDAKEAFFVIGSNVYGPMGHELIPFVSQADAQEFKKDHGGTRIFEFKDIKPAVIKKLD